MTTIAQRRVAGATALMILIYLLQVALFASPAAAVDSNDFQFVFDNGEVWEYPDGSYDDTVTGGDWTVDPDRFADAFASNPNVTTDLSGDDLSLHVSCSESFPGGFVGGTNDFPVSGTHSEWRIASYDIENVIGQGKICGETFVPGSITVVKTTDPATTESFDFDLDGIETPCPGGGGIGCGGTVDESQSIAGEDSGADENSHTWSNLNGGDYTLVELLDENPEGYELESVACVDGNGPIVTASVDTAASAGVLFSLSGAQHITCTFHNVDDTPPTTTTTTTLPPTTTTTTTLPPTTTTTTTLPPTTTTTTLPPTTTTTTLPPPPPPPPPPPSQVLVQVNPICVPDPVNGPGTGELDIDIDPANGATVTINGLGSFTQSTTITDLDDGSAWIVTVSANGGWTLAAGSDTSGTYEIEDCSIEVLGTTVTTAPEEVSADTLPFTGFEAGDTVRLGLLAMVAGLLTLFAAHRPRELEEAAPMMGSSWSDL